MNDNNAVTLMLDQGDLIALAITEAMRREAADLLPTMPMIPVAPVQLQLGAFTPQEEPEPSIFDIEQADALDWLRHRAPESVDLFITDPPYESLEQHRAIGTTTRLRHSKSSSNDWFSIFPNAMFPALFAELYRTLKRDRHLYLFCDHVTFPVAMEAGRAAGFRFWKPLVWDKRRIGMGYHYRSRYEFILFFEKGKRKLADLGVPDVLEAPRIHRGYPTEKPVELIETLVTQSSRPGELVADPFMGSGATGVAALRHGRRFVGCDLSHESLHICRLRLAETQESLRVRDSEE